MAIGRITTSPPPPQVRSTQAAPSPAQAKQPKAQATGAEAPSAIVPGPAQASQARASHFLGQNVDETA